MEGWSKIVGRALQTEIYIDPGTEESGFLVKSYDSEGSPLLVRLGVISNEKTLAEIRQTQDRLVIERLSGMGQMVGQTTLDTAWWAGRMVECALTRGLAVEEMTRRNVKLYLCGQCRAKDKDIRQRVIDVLGPVSTKKNPNPIWPAKPKPSDHVWQAAGLMLAVDLRREERKRASRVTRSA